MRPASAAARRTPTRRGVATAVIVAGVLAACSPGAPIVVATPVPAADTLPTAIAPVATLQSPPAVPAPKPLVLPPVTRRELPNGLEVLIVEHHELPVANFLLLVKSGYEEDPAATPGLVSLTAALLDEGAGRRSALEISAQQALLGASLGVGSGFDATTISLQAPTAQLDSAMALFADVALRPTFAQAELDRLRAERLTLLTQLKDRGPSIADIAHPAIVYGAAHPYGRPTLGTESSVRGFTRADIRDFYRTHFRPNNATLIVVGDVDPEAVMQRVARAFGEWQRGTVPPDAAIARPAGAARAIYLIDKPGAAQSSVRIGSAGVARATPDYFPLLVMNTVLGVPFGSRLNQNLREAKAYTYGARSQFDMRGQGGPFTARAEIVAQKTDSALLEFMHELTRIRDTVPQDELTRAKRYLQTRLPGDFETPSDIASRLVPIALYGLPLDFYNSYSQRVDAVTQADVQRVAERYVDPSTMAIVVVGDRKVVEAGVRQLGIGKVEVRDIGGAAIAVP
jgi:zinc protease